MLVYSGDYWGRVATLFSIFSSNSSSSAPTILPITDPFRKRRNVGVEVTLVDGIVKLSVNIYHRIFHIVANDQQMRVRYNH